MQDISIIDFHGKSPQIPDSVFIAPGVRLIGDLVIGEQSNIWFNTTIRADVNWIRIGARTNVQDNSVIHVTSKTAPTTIGNDVTIGHSAIVHGCTIEDLCLVGMGSVVLDGAVIQKHSLVAAGAVVTPGKTFPSRSLIVGNPGKVMRELTDQEIEGLKESAVHYIETARSYMKSNGIDSI